MAKNIQVHIPEPCHQDWGKMRPEEKGRFCSSCTKTVVDFSLMSDREVLSWLADAGGKTCGRFTTEQLNRNLMSLPEKKRSWWSAWNVMLIGLLLSSRAEAQTTATKGAVHQASKKKRVIVVRDHVPNHVTMGTPRFVQEPDRGSVLVNVIDSVASLPPIEVRGFPAMGKMQVVVGDVRATCIKHTDTSSVLTPLRKLASDTMAFLGMPRRVMSFYPNPAMRGSVIQVSLRSEQAGPYRLALYNAAGSLVLERPVEMGEKEQMELLNIPAFLAGGIYFVQLSGSAMRKPYTAKLLVQ
jgi:hypothetical protein